MMNLKRIVTAVLAGAILVGSMVSCSEKDKVNFLTSLQSAAEIKSFDYSYNLGASYSTDDDSIKTLLNGFSSANVKLSGTYYDTEKVNLIFKASFETSATGTLDLLEINIIDNIIYLNVEKLLATVSSTKLFADLSKYVTMLDGKKWIVIDASNEFKKQTGKELADISNSDIEELGNKALNQFVDILTKAVVDIKPALLSKKNGAYYFTLSHENAQPLLAALATVLTQQAETIADIAEEESKKLLTPDSALAEIAKFDREGTIKKVNDFAAQMSAMVIPSDYAFLFEAHTKLSGGEGARQFELGFDSNFAKENDKIDATIEAKINEVAITPITPPADAITLEELITIAKNKAKEAAEEAAKDAIGSAIGGKIDGGFDGVINDAFKDIVNGAVDSIGGIING